MMPHIIPDLETTTNSVSLHLPEFFTSNLRVWFVQPEIYFRNRRTMTSSAKYEQLSIPLPDRVASKVLDILENPPEVEPCITSKNALLSYQSSLLHKVFLHMPLAG